jgi:DNA invertase Pin-like site-specific DNA recombinase
VHFVVVFNLTRFARDKYDHFARRSHLQSLGISLRSATEPTNDGHSVAISLLSVRTAQEKVLRESRGWMIGLLCA